MQVVAENSAFRAASSEHQIENTKKDENIKEPNVRRLDAKGTNAKGLNPQTLESFCQLQIEQLTAQAPIVWAQIVCYDPLLKNHREVVSQAQGMPPLSPDTIAYLRSGNWLSDFPLVLTLTELTFDFPVSSPEINPTSNQYSHRGYTHKGYICPIGYRDCKPEYLLVLASEPLSAALQENLIKCALILTKYSELYHSFHHQNTETQLLEHIVHRVGHQLRNPLSLIALYAENLYLGTSSSGIQEQATVIRETVQDLLSNLTDLIYCGKSSQLQVTLQDLRALVAESVQGLLPWIEQKQLKIVYPSTSVMLKVDRLQMKQVFDNLLSNAVHFSSDSSTIEIDWRSFQGEVLIQVTDQGQGLSQDDLRKIFTPFYSRRSGGTGLGLTIAKKIVLDHQGSLWAQNMPEGGARFSFTLPRSTTILNGSEEYA